MAKRKTQKLNPAAQLTATLHAWAAEAPADMADESPKEKLLDSMLRLFEALDTANLRGYVQTTGLRHSLPEFSSALRWQLLALNLPMPTAVQPVVPFALSLLLLRWIPIWLAETTPGMPKLMAALDRDLGYAEKAAGLLRAG
jgi:hypothetical protein